MKEVFGPTSVAEDPLTDGHQERGISVVQPTEGGAVSGGDQRDERVIVLFSRLRRRPGGRLDLGVAHGAGA